MVNIKLLDVNNDWKQARPLLQKVGDSFIYSGYQNFCITPTNISAISDNVKLKFNLIKPYVFDDVINKSVADIGCSNLFFGFLAKLYGASTVVGVDLDLEYLDLNSKLIHSLGFSNIECKNMNAAEYKDQHDTVFAFAIIHWIYSCTGFLGSLENVVKHFKLITKKCLYIEWIDPTDDCITDMLHHLDFNKEFTTNDYSKENFIRYLRENFQEVLYLGNSKNTREIYRCLI